MTLTSGHPNSNDARLILVAEDNNTLSINLSNEFAVTLHEAFKDPTAPSEVRFATLLKDGINKAVFPPVLFQEERLESLKKQIRKIERMMERINRKGLLKEQIPNENTKGENHTSGNDKDSLNAMKRIFHVGREVLRDADYKGSRTVHAIRRATREICFLRQGETRLVKDPTCLFQFDMFGAATDVQQTLPLQHPPDIDLPNSFETAYRFLHNFRVMKQAMIENWTISRDTNRRGRTVYTVYVPSTIEELRFAKFGIEMGVVVQDAEGHDHKYMERLDFAKNQRTKMTANYDTTSKDWLNNYVLSLKPLQAHSHFSQWFADGVYFTEFRVGRTKEQNNCVLPETTKGFQEVKELNIIKYDPPVNLVVDVAPVKVTSTGVKRRQWDLRAYLSGKFTMIAEKLDESQSEEEPVADPSQSPMEVPPEEPRKRRRRCWDVTNIQQPDLTKIQQPDLTKGQCRRTSLFAQSNLMCRKRSLCSKRSRSMVDLRTAGQTQFLQPPWKF